MQISDAIREFTSWQKFSRREATVASYRNYLMQFGVFVQNKQIEETTYGDVMNYLNMRKQFDWDKNSYLALTVGLRKFFEYFKRKGQITWDHELIPIIEREYKFPKVATEGSYQKLLVSIPNSNDPRYIRNKAIIMLFWDSGMRLGELISLNLSDLDFVKMRACIQTEKAKSVTPIRMVMWTEETNKALKEWVEKREHLTNTMKNEVDKNALFISINTTKGGQRINKSGINEMLRRYSLKAGIGFTVNAHSLRHHFGRDLATKGANNSTISSMLGHSSLQSSYVYTVLAGNDMEEQYKKYKRQPA